MKCDQSTKNRMQRIKGQVQGVINMMEDERSCEDIVIQLSAIRSSVDKVISLITTNNLLSTIEKNYDISIEGVEEAINLVVKSK